MRDMNAMEVMLDQPDLPAGPEWTDIFAASGYMRTPMAKYWRLRRAGWFMTYLGFTRDEMTDIDKLVDGRMDPTLWTFARKLKGLAVDFDRVPDEHKHDAHQRLQGMGVDTIEISNMLQFATRNCR
jgi:predicted DNA-binding helix-hairpin-helix protein